MTLFLSKTVIVEISGNLLIVSCEWASNLPPLNKNIKSVPITFSLNPNLCTNSFKRFSTVIFLSALINTFIPVLASNFIFFIFELCENPRFSDS